MTKQLIDLIRKTPLYAPLRNWMRKRWEAQAYQAWVDGGSPIPMPHTIKERTVRQYADQYHLRVLVETGTYYGEMVDVMKTRFQHIYSIELSQDLWQRAKDLFSTETNVEIIFGDSGEQLKSICASLTEPALFWLDAHYAGGTTAGEKETSPIYAELEQIFNNKAREHVILIDDARYFTGNSAYPTIEELESFVRTQRDNLHVAIEDDIIRIVPE